MKGEKTMEITNKDIFKKHYDFSNLEEDVKTKLEENGSAVFFKTVAVQYETLGNRSYIFHDYEVFNSMEECDNYLCTYYKKLSEKWLHTDIEANVIYPGDICIVADNIVRRLEQMLCIQTIKV